MGVYYQQALTVSGEKEELDLFIKYFFRMDDSGQPSDIDFERAAPTPEILPEFYTSSSLGNDVYAAVEALLGRPLPARVIDGVALQQPSALSTDEAKKRRLIDHDALLRWLKKHQPKTLAIGKAAIAAHEQTGYWSRSEWQLDNWGPSDLIDFEIAIREPEKIIVRLSSKGMPINPLIRHVRNKYSSLKFRIAFKDDSNEIFGIAEIVDEVFKDTYVEATEELLTEIEGQPRTIEPEYETTSVLLPSPKTHFRFWFAERRVRKALEAYPVYQPPYAGLPATLSADEVAANFRHFLETIPERMGNLRRFLDRFGVSLGRSKQELKSLDRWLQKHGAFLIVGETGSAFLTHRPAWSGPWKGYNAIFDLATFLGELAIERNDSSQWALYTEVPPGLRASDPLFQQIYIKGSDSNNAKYLWIFDKIYRTCFFLKEHSYQWKKSTVFSKTKIYKTSIFAYDLE